MILLISEFLLKASVSDNAVLSQCHGDAKTDFLLPALFLAAHWTYRKMKQNAVLPYFLLLFTDCMDQCPFFEAKSPWARQGTLRLKWNTDVHYRVHNSPLLLRILRPIKFYPLSHPICWRAIYCLLSSHLLLGIPSGLFPSGFLTRTLYDTLLPPRRATCSVNHSLIWSHGYCSVRSSDLEAPHCWLSVLHSLSLCPSQAQIRIYSLALCSQTPSAYIPIHINK